MTYKRSTLTGRAKSAPAPKTRLEERIGPRITLMGTLIAAFVGINTFITSCSSRTSTYYAGFRDAVEVEETFWRALYSDYFSVLRDDPAEPQLTARLDMLSDLAQRDVPAFREFRLGILRDDKRAKEAAVARLSQLRDRLRETLNRSAPIAAARQDENFREAEAERIQRRVDGEAVRGNESVVTSFPTDAGAAIIYQPQTLTLGDRSGLDIDIFWCGGGGQAAEAPNYRAGLIAARTLADKQARGEPLASGLPLGRIRLIMLPESRQGQTHDRRGGGGTYPRRGYGLAIHADDNELEWGRALARLVAGYQVRRSATRTRWYMSLFSCAAGGDANETTAPGAAETMAT